ncbi:DeoR family regulatory proteins [Jeotgalicoccus coquinae]|uniref:DeoR/GlpR family transcriptional regulator of sugar metabolism n=1 Tax=Jeotgalicoccus coquinae TaxID=709509 RepID=A0A6V7RMZ0_9STAP|nr:DeoR/GlpR family DNA-binding transcription regulator [Jeotgalicoccus coquinae]MBB6422109.1 DeoR/GlpR family transcriptional regulator of sugar metabolism [Jeotgalicoccus coquinae]GGE18575.1 DeoR family regulatory proteins [Jeotgalicoccus coquinae]CAD2079713.1 Glycerol-3-phosphate regulon repressor [Jeotgalicoccus coquinae]
MKSKRQKYIINRVAGDSSVTIEQLADELNVSEMTVRRDLKELEDDEQIIRTSNSILLKDSFLNEVPFVKKQLVNIEEKRLIAKKAMKFIKPDETILLDAGTTTLEICKLLKNEDFTVRVVTNDIKAAAELIDSRHEVIILGGTVQQNVGSIYGPQTIDVLNDIKVNVSFVGTQAMKIDEGIFAPTIEKAKVKRLMMKCGQTAYLIVDSSKLNHTAFSKICDLKDFTGIITDNNVGEEELKQLAEHTTVI